MLARYASVPIAHVATSTSTGRFGSLIAAHIPQLAPTSPADIERMRRCRSVLVVSGTECRGDNQCLA